MAGKPVEDGAGTIFAMVEKTSETSAAAGNTEAYKIGEVRNVLAVMEGFPHHHTPDRPISF
jgi:hypothetical protein